MNTKNYIAYFINHIDTGGWGNPFSLNKQSIKIQQLYVSTFLC